MPVSHERSGRLYTIKCTGRYQAEELEAALDEVAALPDLPPSPVLLLDLRTAGSVLDRSVAELKDVASHFVKRAGRFGNRAVIVVSGAARYGLMRMAATWVSFEGVTVHVFCDLDEACDWLLEVAPTARASG